MHFRVFSQGQDTVLGMFLGWLKFRIFLGCLKSLILILGLTVDAWPEPKYEEKMRVPPPPPLRLKHLVPINLQFLFVLLELW